MQEYFDLTTGLLEEYDEEPYTQREYIRDVMRDKQWRTLDFIAEITGAPAPSVSAQLRHLRKAKYGGHTVNKRRNDVGVYEYQLIVNEASND